MATKSILKSVNIKDKYFGRNLINALENAEKKGSKEIVLSKSVKTISRSQIKKIFGE